MTSELLFPPKIFEFHDYRKFLKSWLAYKKNQKEKFSLRAWAKACELSPSYLTMILNGDRNLTSAALKKISKTLKLTQLEEKYMECLFILADADDQEARVDAIQKMQRFGRYKANHTDEVKFYQYLSKWYYTAIREMAEMNSFKLDAQWIQDNLIEKVSKKDIQKALKFLVSYGFIVPDDDGGASIDDQRLRCSGDVHKLALSEAHKEMFGQAIKSIDRCSKDQRWLYGNTIALAEDQLPAVVKILKEANQKIANLEKKKKNNDSVFHTGLMVFPLTKNSGERL